MRESSFHTLFSTLLLLRCVKLCISFVNFYIYIVDQCTTLQNDTALNEMRASSGGPPEAVAGQTGYGMNASNEGPPEAASTAGQAGYRENASTGGPQEAASLAGQTGHGMNASSGGLPEAASTAGQAGYRENVSTGGLQEAAQAASRQAARSRRRRRASELVPEQDAPTKRRRLRDLPVRRAAASLATTAAPSLAAGEEVTGGEDAASAGAKACPVCLANPADVAIIPCGHCICGRCFDQITSMPAVNPDAPQLKTCPVCRVHIRDRLRLHFVL